MGARLGTRLKDHTVLALDIGSRFIKIAELRLAKGRISLLNAAVGPTPPDAVDASQILDPVALGKAVNHLLTLHRIHTRRVILSVAGQTSVIVRPIDLPRVTRKELPETVRFEVEKYIPFSLDEVVMDYAPITPPEELPPDATTLRVLLAVAQEELIQSYLKVLKAAKLQPVAMDVEILASIRSMVDLARNQGEPDETVVLVNVGAGHTDISIVNGGDLAFTRTVPLGGNTLTEAIADQLGRSLEEAEVLKIEHGRIFLDTLPGDASVALPGTEATVAAAGDVFGYASGAAHLPESDGGPIPPNLLSLDDEADEPSETGAGAATLVIGETPAVAPVTPPVTPSAPLPAASSAGGEGAAPLFDLTSELAAQMPVTPQPSAHIANAPTPDFFAPASALSPAPTPPVAQPDSNDDTQAYRFELDAATDGFTVAGAPTADSEEKLPDDIFARRIFESMVPSLAELAAEIRRSLEFFANHEPDVEVRRIVLMGGTSRLPALATFVHHELGGTVEVVCADPLARLDLSQVRQPQEYVNAVAPALPVCVGLGLRDMVV